MGCHNKQSLSSIPDPLQREADQSSASHCQDMSISKGQCSTNAELEPPGCTHSLRMGCYPSFQPCPSPTLSHGPAPVSVRSPQLRFLARCGISRGQVTFSSSRAVIYGVDWDPTLQEVLCTGPPWGGRSRGSKTVHDRGGSEDRLFTLCLRQAGEATQGSLKSTEGSIFSSNA